MATANKNNSGVTRLVGLAAADSLSQLQGLLKRAPDAPIQNIELKGPNSKLAKQQNYQVFQQATEHSKLLSTVIQVCQEVARAQRNQLYEQDHEAYKKLAQQMREFNFATIIQRQRTEAQLQQLRNFQLDEQRILEMQRAMAQLLGKQSSWLKEHREQIEQQVADALLPEIAAMAEFRDLDTAQQQQVASIFARGATDIYERAIEHIQAHPEQIDFDVSDPEQVAEHIGSMINSPENASLFSEVFDQCQQEVNQILPEGTEISAERAMEVIRTNALPLLAQQLQQSLTQDLDLGQQAAPPQAELADLDELAIPAVAAVDDAEALTSAEVDAAIDAMFSGSDEEIDWSDSIDFDDSESVAEHLEAGLNSDLDELQPAGNRRRMLTQFNGANGSSSNQTQSATAANADPAATNQDPDTPEPAAPRRPGRRT